MRKPKPRKINTRPKYHIAGNYVDLAGIFEELAALRKIAFTARSLVKSSRGTGERFPALERDLECLDAAYWHQAHADPRNPTK